MSTDVGGFLEVDRVEKLTEYNEDDSKAHANFRERERARVFRGVTSVIGGPHHDEPYDNDD